MSETYGQRSNLGICFQDSYGTSNVNSMHWIQFTSEDVRLVKEPLKSQNMRGIFEEGDAYEGKNMCEGPIAAEAHPITLGVFLTAIFGPPSTTQVDSVYEHRWKPRTTDFDDFVANIPFTLYKFFNDGGSAFLYYDLVGASFEMACANGEFLQSTLNVAGGNFSQVADIAPAYPTGKRWAWDVASVTFGGAQNCALVDLTVSVDEAVEAYHTLCAERGKFPTRVKHGGFRTVEVSGTIKYDNQDEYQQYVAFAERELIVHFKGPVEVSSGRTEDFTVIVPAMQYTDYPVTATGPGPIEVGFSANGNYGVNSATAIEFVLVNTQDAYV